MEKEGDIGELIGLPYLRRGGCEEERNRRSAAIRRERDKTSE